MDSDPGRVAVIPDPPAGPPGAERLVPRREDPTVREVKALREDEHTRIDIALIWAQKGETFWMVDLNRLDAGRVVDAMLLTPDAPFGSAPWTELSHTERAQLYWGALQALCARPSFERSVADAWVRAAMKLEGVQESNTGSLVNRLRRDAMDDARATIAQGLASKVDIDAIVKSADPTKVMLDWLRSTNHDGGRQKFWGLIRARIDEHVGEAVRMELDARLGETFEYLRKSMGMAVNNAIGRLGAAGKVGP